MGATGFGINYDPSSNEKNLLNEKECSACGKEVANHLQKLLKRERTCTDVT
jgi:hypothetical protein